MLTIRRLTEASDPSEIMIICICCDTTRLTVCISCDATRWAAIEWAGIAHQATKGHFFLSETHGT